MTVTPAAGVGSALREWRSRRRLSQLDLALDAGISARHLSFVETGRSKPGREMLLAVLRRLEVPFREQNRLLIAAGHAPAFPERALDDPDLAPVHAALELILRQHEPFPGVAFDRHWNLVAANAPMTAIARDIEIDPGLLEPPVNLLRLGFHPRGLAPHMTNIADWRAHFRERVEHQLATSGDETLRALLEEIDGYSREYDEPDGDLESGTSNRDILGPLGVRAPDGREASFIGMFATFDTPFEVTASELAVELLFPADQATAELLEDLAQRRR